MARRLGLGPEIRELKLGPTFTGGDSTTVFHTLKYDFKPASVDVSKVAKVDVGVDNTMTVTVPHSDGAGIPHTIFKGSQRLYSKECVLIIDRTTGEITLEKLSSNIQVKKTRAEPKSLLAVPSANGFNRSVSPVELRTSPTNGRSTSRTRVTSGKKRDPTVQLSSKPSNSQQRQSPLTVSSYRTRSPSNFPSNRSPGQHSLGASTLASLPMIGTDVDDYAPIAPPPAVPTPNAAHASTISVRTSAESCVDRVNEQIQVGKLSSNDATRCKNNIPDGSGALSDSSSGSSSSDSSDSDSDTENNLARINPTTSTNGHANGATSSPLLNMPDNLLNDDLQLSESESDSD